MNGNLSFNFSSYTKGTLLEKIDKYDTYPSNFTQSLDGLLPGFVANQTKIKVVDTTPSITDRSDFHDSYTDIYYYNYDDSLNNIRLEELVPNALGYGAMFVIGIIGNLLVIISVARYRRMHNVTNIFFLSMASADLLLISVCIPIKFARFFTFTWEYGEVVCKAVHYFQNLTIICSVLNLSGLSIERYYAIIHPMRAKYICTVTMARRSVLLIWTLSVIMAVPILVGQRHRLVGEIRKGYWCIEDWNSSVVAKVYNLYMFLVVFVFPLGLMAYAYFSICMRLRVVKYQHKYVEETQNYAGPEQTSFSPHEVAHGSVVLRGLIPKYSQRVCSGHEDATRKQVVKMLVFVVVLFAICWGPVVLNNVLVAFGVLHYLNHGYLKPMRQGLWLMAYINSCLNPIVYGFMSKNFRESFRNTMRMWVWKSSTRDIPRHRNMWRCSFHAHDDLSTRLQTFYYSQRRAILISVEQYFGFQDKVYK